MKTLKSFIFCAVISLTVSLSANAQVVRHVPTWGLRGYEQVRYYYLPDVEIYYDGGLGMFIYYEGNGWKYRRNLPAWLSGYDLYHAYRVPLVNYNGIPYRYHSDFLNRYARRDHYYYNRYYNNFYDHYYRHQEHREPMNNNHRPNGNNSFGGNGGSVNNHRPGGNNNFGGNGGSVNHRPDNNQNNFGGNGNNSNNHRPINNQNNFGGNGGSSNNHANHRENENRQENANSSRPTNSNNSGGRR